MRSLEVRGRASRAENVSICLTNMWNDHVHKRSVLNGQGGIYKLRSACLQHRLRQKVHVGPLMPELDSRSVNHLRCSRLAKIFGLGDQSVISYPKSRAGFDLTAQGELSRHGEQDSRLMAREMEERLLGRHGW